MKKKISRFALHKLVRQIRSLDGAENPYVMIRVCLVLPKKADPETVAFALNLREQLSAQDCDAYISDVLSFDGKSLSGKAFCLMPPLPLTALVIRVYNRRDIVPPARLLQQKIETILHHLLVSLHYRR